MAEELGITFKVNADTRQSEAVERSVNKTGKAAEKAAREGSTAFGNLGKCVERATSTVGKLNAILSGFGVFGLVNTVITSFESLNEWLHKDEEAARKLREELALKHAEEEVRKLSEGYKGLKEAIAGASDARQRDNELFSEEVRIRREAQDADMAAAEADALAGVDPNAPDADRQREGIRASFEASRARTAADRKREDVVFRRQALRQQAEDATGAADRIEASLGADDKAILRARTKASTLEALSKERNEKDGTWYNPRKRTAEGDAERERQRKEAEAARKEADRLEAEKKAKEREIADLRARAEHAGKMGDLLFASIGTAETERQTATTRQNAGDAERKAKAEAEAAKIADAEKARNLLTRQKADVEAKIAAEQARKNAAGLAVYRAQGGYDLAVTGGSSRDQRTAYGALQQAQQTAQNVGFSADQAINALTETLKRVEEKLNEAKRVIEGQEKRQSFAVSETPAP